MLEIIKTKMAHHDHYDLVWEIFDEEYERN